MAGRFALDVSRFTKKAQGNMDLVLRKVLLDLFTRVIRRTPVDTGRARGNWMCSVSQAAMQQTGVLDRTSAGRGGGQAIAAMSETALNAKVGDVVYLTNTLPYILQLEYGSSKQAPAGMVGITLQEYPGIVEMAAGEADR